ncbi:heavy-metal-associated domain-containing protein [Variovorax sp.]|uniref:heavy-metal-associated domain-containing protein n=1 Tax=Variovorax sp. TaxID=1871043 RepID=UPI002D24B9F3|nr:heavy-metal-associated domain-containing protein [Variovorax sp.]HYP82456.1 heavy-metal-associated domain-containing protein [Variovorax sp.]
MSTTNHHEFRVTGMSCNHCANAIRQAVTDLDPQARVHVDLAGAQVAVDSAQPRDPVAAAIADAGYIVQ